MNIERNELIRMKRSPTHVSMKIAISFCTALILFQAGCKNNPVDVQTKNPREYTWDITSLSFPNSASTRMYSIWASNTKDVYVSGFNSIGPPVYHYDGSQWVPLTTMPNVVSSLWEIRGFSAKDIWGAGEKPFFDSGRQRFTDSAVVLHFDGVDWKEVLPAGMGVGGLKSMWGGSPSNILFGSRNGMVIRFDGKNWTVDTLYPGLSIEALGGQAGRVFAFGKTVRGVADDSVLSCMWTNSVWTRLDWQLWSDWLLVPKFGLTQFYSPGPGELYSSAFGGVFRQSGTMWTRVFADPQSAIFGIGGNGSRNVLAVGWSGERKGPILVHWDGDNWAEVKLSEILTQKLSGAEFYDVWMNDTDTFIVGHNGTTSFVLHGK
jgi:hypothetical protein